MELLFSYTCHRIRGHLPKLRGGFNCDCSNYRIEATGLPKVKRY
jgi:hypothetical protein